MVDVYSNIYQQNIKSEIDYIFLNSILLNKLWEEHIVIKITNLLEENTDFIDVGSNIGLISLGVNLYTSQNNKKINNIHCFECNVNIFMNLKYNTSHHKNIKIYNFGLGDNFGLGNMSINSNNYGTSFIKNVYENNKNEIINYNCFEINENTNKIEENIFFTIIELDSIRHLFKNRVSVIKVDIEGYEKQFLIGAKYFIKEHKPYIFIEIFDELKDEIFDILINKLNYKLLENIKENENLKSIDYLFEPNF